MTNNKFKSYDDGIDMSEIDAMFRERDTMKVVNSFEQSMRTGENRRKPRRNKKNPNSYIIVIASLAAAGGIVFGAHIAKPTPKGTLNDFSRELGSVVFVQDDSFNPNYDTTNISIVAQNTKRNAETYYYDHEGIAKDLLKLDDRLLDIGFISTCEDMGENLNNKVGVAGETNIDLLIENIKLYAEEGSYAEKDFKDINTLNEWLTKRGFTDSKGKPDLQSAINHYATQKNIFTNIVNQEKELKDEEGVTLK